MNDKYPFLKSFLEKYRLALQNKSKEVRWTMNELHDIVTDIHDLQSSIEEKYQDQTESKMLMAALLKELKLLNSAETDAGSFTA